ncbi:putative RNA-binding protein (virulence factor B family) [Paenibacillus shirakamiensis]|uniref:RNA-binding protein (Virulence factor B family) n=1 Tax=Paenibacillus shirakamiensis TaxID=1265935 RepID=A0ABS4JDH0_9BACL|nr:S1-like domain-containing RNA-binding protein [Paenibacillus shirakamiensis]MBP1999120.1 putative RNA-binding protein (virulence factor B family) [Paenibacillus shirakamiensis]
MNFIAGTTVSLMIDREVSPYGFFLQSGAQDVLLHYTELTHEVEPGDTVDVFLFYDTEDRLAATMKKPYIQLGELAKLEVADVHPRLGCFLEMGLGRQLLLPIRELPELKELQPQVGDQVFVIMDHDKQGRLKAKIANELDLIPLTFHAPTTWNNEWVDVTVYKPLQMGTFVVIDGGVLGFGAIGMIHSSERNRLLRLGEQLKVRVAHIREDGRVNLSMAPRKEIGRSEDAEHILEYLTNRPGGGMPYSDATPPDVIKQRFGISKAAFKRAMGKLLKEGKIRQEENWTYLVQPMSTTDTAPEMDGQA